MALLYSHDHNVFLHAISVRVRSVKLCVERFEYKHGHIRLIYSTTIVNVLKRVLLIAKSFSKIFSKPSASLEDHHFCFDTCLFCDVNFFQICKQTFWLWLAPSNYTCSPDGHFLAKSFKIFYCVCRIFTNFWTFRLCLHVIKLLNFLNMQGNYSTAKQSFRPSDVE